MKCSVCEELKTRTHLGVPVCEEHYLIMLKLESNRDNYWKVRSRVLTTQLRRKVTPHNKTLARYKTKKAIASGVIKKLSCEVCGSKDSQVHHLDYNNPLEVIFLCDTHHRQWHRDNKNL